MLNGADRLNVRLTTLRAVSRALARPLDLVDILRSIYKEIFGVLDVMICFFGLYDAAAESVEVVWQMHDGVELPGGHFPLGTGFTSQVIRNVRPHLIRNWSQEGPRVQVQYATDRPSLPESAITVPVVFDGRVLGVLSLQSYRVEAFDEEDVELLQDVAAQAAVAISAAKHAWAEVNEASTRASEVEAILASMPAGVLVIDHDGRLVRLNQAARSLLCEGGSVILGLPLDRSQDGHWPLGTESVTDKLRPMIELLKRGQALAEEVHFVLPGAAASTSVACKCSVLMRGESPAGGVLVLRELPAANPE
jgi:putative methionine-R-sulfoxide reductase with GAF domain